jgi:hypothetical protein
MEGYLLNERMIMSDYLKAIFLLVISSAVFAATGADGLLFLDYSLPSEIQSAQGTFPTIIANGQHPSAQGRGEWKISFKEDLTIGVKEGDENYMFGNRLYFTVDDDGNIYAVDWDRKRIQKYGADGKYLLTIGRPGQGPGEFGNIWTPFFDGQGTLYVRDISNQKLAFFERSGKFVKAIKVPHKVGDIQINSHGIYVTSVSQEIVEPNGDMKVLTHYGLFDKDFNPIAVFQVTAETMTRRSGSAAESAAKRLAESMSRMAFPPKVTMLLDSDDRIYIGYPETFEIRVYSPDGKPERIIRKDQLPQLMMEQHKKDYVALQEKDFLLYLADIYPESIRKKALDMITYPKYLPAYQKFTFMDNGWLAVVVSTTRDGPTKIDVFDENGIYIAEVTAQIPVDGLKFSKDKVYAVMESDDGFKFIKRYTWTAVKK